MFEEYYTFKCIFNPRNSRPSLHDMKTSGISFLTCPPLALNSYNKELSWLSCCVLEVYLKHCLFFNIRLFKFMVTMVTDGKICTSYITKWGKKIWLSTMKEHIHIRFHCFDLHVCWILDMFRQYIHIARKIYRNGNKPVLWKYLVLRVSCWYRVFLLRSLTDC